MFMFGKEAYIFTGVYYFLFQVFLPFAFLMVFVSMFLVILPVVQAPKGAGIALAMILSGIPVYFVFVHYKLHLKIRGFQTLLGMYSLYFLSFLFCKDKTWRVIV